MAHHRHKREPNARRLVALTGSRAARFAVGAAVATTLPAVALGVLAADPPSHASLTAQQVPAVILDPSRYDTQPISRSFDRAAARSFQQGVAAQAATVRAVKKAHVQKWTTVDLNLWSSASQAARQVGLLSSGKHVLVTGRVTDGRAELVVNGQSRWVTAGYLTDQKPDPSSAAGGGVTAAAGLSMAPCPDGSVEYRLTVGRGLRLPLGVPRLPADHVVRRVGRPRRARQRQGARHHDQRRRPRQRDRGVPPGPRRRARTSTTSCGSSTSGRPCGPPRAGDCSPTAGHRRPTTCDHVHVSVN